MLKFFLLFPPSHTCTRECSKIINDIYFKYILFLSYAHHAKERKSEREWPESWIIGSKRVCKRLCTQNTLRSLEKQERVCSLKDRITSHFNPGAGYFYSPQSMALKFFVIILIFGGSRAKNVIYYVYNIHYQNIVF